MNETYFSWTSMIPAAIRNRFAGSDVRSKNAIKNILLSMLSKFFSILSSLLIVPLTIHYINPTQYGIWLTLSSIIGWISFFDLGLGNGFRNKFSAARAQGNNRLARQYLSTTYFAIGSIVLLVFLVTAILNPYIDWCMFLNIPSSYAEELHTVFLILTGFFCLSMVMNIFGTMLTADQKAGFSSLITGCGQVFSLLMILILTKTTSGSLTNLALYYAGIPCITMLVFSVYAFFFTRYKSFRPSFSHVRLSLIKDIMNLGLQFFTIYLCLIAIFQIINIVITREIGPDGVTVYNIAKRYYNIPYMLIIITLTPIWSAFTEAYTQKDFVWMRSILHKFERLFLYTILISLVMLLVSSFFYGIWIGDSVEIPLTVTIATMILMLSQSIGVIYMHMINGIGYIRIQTITYIIMALLSWPCMVLAARQFSIPGVLLIPTITYMIQALLGKIQIEKLLAGKATGIWKK